MTKKIIKNDFNIDSQFLEQYQTPILALQTEGLMLKSISKQLCLTLDTIRNFFQYLGEIRCLGCGMIKTINYNNFPLWRVETRFIQRCRECNNRDHKNNKHQRENEEHLGEDFCQYYGEKIMELFKEGKNRKVIAETLGVKIWQITEYFKKIGKPGIRLTKKPPTERICEICHQNKDIGEFGTHTKANGKTYHYRICKNCELITTRKQCKDKIDKFTFTQEQLIKVKALFDKELGVDDICSGVGLAKPLVRKAFRQLGLYKVRRTKDLNQEIVDKVLEMDKDNKSLRQISDALGLSRNPIKDILAKEGRKRKKGERKLKPIIIPTDRECRSCNEVKPINEFAKLIKFRKNGDERIEYDYHCYGCSIPNSLINRAIVLLVKNPLAIITDIEPKEVFKELGYTLQQMRDHLEAQFEPWMTWKNHGKYLKKKWQDNNIETWCWNIDHIIPKSLFPYKSIYEENFKKCWALSNLRPYSAKLNVLDGASRIRHKKPLEQTA